MGKRAPKPDPQIGEAAVRSTELGEQYLAFMRNQSAVTNRWADEDRARYRAVFEPLQDQFIAEAQGFDTPGRRAQLGREAFADVRQQFAMGRQQEERRLAAMGVRPDSGRGMDAMRRDRNAESLAAAGAQNLARRNVEDMGRNLRGSTVNMGAGFAVNPGTSMGLSNAAAGAGFSGAMGGQQAKAGILQGQNNSQMQAWQANQHMLGSTLGGIGMGLGAFFSSKDVKEKKRKPKSALETVKKMPVEEWQYKPGVQDGGAKRHVGPYAEDFQRATGMGDGQKIEVQDALGVTMGAVQELAGKVDKLARKAG